MKMQGGSLLVVRNVLLGLVLFLLGIMPASYAQEDNENNAIGPVEKIVSFSSGLAGISLGGYWGYIDAFGKIVIKPIFREVGLFSANYAPARVDEKWGYINRKGLFVINPTFDQARPFSGGLAPVRKQNLWGVINTNGKVVHDYSFDDLKSFGQGLAPAKRLGKWGFINTEGKFVIKRAWLDAGEFSEGLAPVENLENHWGYINTDGRTTIEYQFDDAGEFSEGLAPVRVESKWGYVNRKGKYRINPEYEQAKCFSEKLAAVKKDGKWGYINSKGKDVIPFTFEKADEFSSGRALVETDEFVFYIDRKGKKVLDISIKKGRKAVAVAAPAPVAVKREVLASVVAAPGVEVNYVSAALIDATDGAHKDDAVYLIRIKGSGLNQDQLFQEGLNGFKYEIDSVDNPGKYKAYAYPLTGVKYSEDGYKSAEIRPNETVFYWLGPKSDGKQQVKVTQYTRDFNNGIDKKSAPVIKPLPAGIPAPTDLKYTVRFYTSAGETYANGVCASILGIRLEDANQKEAPPEIYDRLVFYSKEQSGAINRDRVIGADPADENYVALIPAQWEKKETPKPHYGFINQIPQVAVTYRFYHLFAMPTSKDYRLISVGLINDKGEIEKYNDFRVNIRQSQDLSFSLEPRDDPNSNKVRTLTLKAPSTLDLTDPSSGEFDFVFEKAPAVKEYYILPVFPEGMNERDITARFNFASFLRGFYIAPIYSGSKVVGFNLPDNTSSLYNTCGRNIFAYVFDIYGRYDRSSLFKDNEKKIVKRDSGVQEESLHLMWRGHDNADMPHAKGSRFMLCLENVTPLPIIYYSWGRTEDSKMDYKKMNYPKIAIIVGPNKNSFYATADDQLFNKETHALWEMEGRTLLSPVSRFKNKLQAIKTAAGPSGFIRIKSERDYKSISHERPCGTDSLFRFAYPKADRRLTHWIVRYKEWIYIFDGVFYGGDDRANYVSGGDFNGTMHTDYFNQDTW
jgi:hypothetical protein